MYRFIFAVLSAVVCFAAAPVEAQQHTHVLSGLTVAAQGANNNLTLSPAFAAGTGGQKYEFTTSIAVDVDTVIVTPTWTAPATDAVYKVVTTISGRTVASGTATKFRVRHGGRTIGVVVNAVQREKRTPPMVPSFPRGVSAT